jgi:hypothetical protein
MGRRCQVGPDEVVALQAAAGRHPHDQEEDLMESPPGAPTSSLTDHGEPMPGVATAQADGNSVSRPKGVIPPPRKLTDEQEREVRRLYAETTAPLGEIARRFGFSQTSVARIAQRHGASLRLRPATPPGGSQPTAPRSARP